MHKVYPNKMLAYNCSPSFNWEANIDKATIAKFQREIGAMGYKFQFVTLAGFHSLNHGMFELARGYKADGMAAYSACSRPSSPRRRTATRRRATSAKSAPATSIWSRPPSPAVSPRPRRSTTRPKPRSSSRGSDIKVQAAE